MISSKDSGEKWIVRDCIKVGSDFRFIQRYMSE